MPHKEWQEGEVLIASAVNTFLMNQMVMTFADASARGSAIPTPVEGMVTYIGGGTVQVYDGATWLDL